MMGRNVLIALARGGGVDSGGEGLGRMMLIVRRGVIGHDRMRTLVIVVVGG